MKGVIEKRRFLAALLPKAEDLKKIRISGARLTGKSTLSKYLAIPEKPNKNTVHHYELFPLSLAELFSESNCSLRFPLLDRLLYAEKIENILESISTKISLEENSRRKNAQTYMLKYGGFPGVLHVSEERRYDWLKIYLTSHLNYDFAALTHTATLLNYSELAREADISVDSARRYIEQLRQSYFIELVQPYHTDLTSRVVKTPKLYWLDVGLWRALSHIYNESDKNSYETFIVSECIKWIRTAKREVKYYFYRTRSGLEVDLLFELPHGILGLEIKSRSNVVGRDVTPMKELAEKLKSKWLGGVVVYNGDEIKKMAEPNIWALPSWRLLT